MGKTKALDKEQKQSKLQWFLIVIVIPFLIIVALILGALTVADINIIKAAKEYGAKIPVISSLIPTEEKIEANELKKEISNLQAVINDKNEQINKLKNNIDKRDSEINQLKLDLELLNKQLVSEEKSQESEKALINDILAVYEAMSSKNAASIIPEMQDSDAIAILSELSEEKVAEILEKMDPKKAAKYTELLAKN